MSEFADGGADAPAAPDAASTVAIPESAPSPDKTLPSQVPPIDKPEPKPETKPAKEEKPEPSKNASDAIRKANEAAKAKQAAESKPKAPETAQRPAEKAHEPKPSEQRDRAPDGKFAPREGQDRQSETQEHQQPAPQQSQHREAPSRFDDAAKAEWEKTPETVRGAVARMEREFNNGFAKHRESAERYNEVKWYDELARQNGSDLKGTLTKLKDIEDAFERDPIGGFQKVAQHFGYNIRDVAAYILNQTPDQVQSQNDATINNLRRQVETLSQQLGGVTQHIQGRAEADSLSKVETFARDNPRFEELAEDIEFFIKSGRTSDLAEAYKLAERLNPSDDPPPRPSAAHTGNPPQRAQSPEPQPPNPAGRKSITGAPSSGSDPVNKVPPSSSTREALEKAARRLVRA